MEYSKEDHHWPKVNVVGKSGFFFTLQRTQNSTNRNKLGTLGDALSLPVIFNKCYLYFNCLALSFCQRCHHQVISHVTLGWCLICSSFIAQPLKKIDLLSGVLKTAW